MIRLFILLIFVATSANAHEHGIRLQMTNPTVGVTVNVIYRSKPTLEENRALCQLDGDFLLSTRPNNTYTCEKE